MFPYAVDRLIASDSILFSWTPSTSARTPGTIAGYNIYFGTNGIGDHSNTNVYIGKLANTKITNLVPGALYFFEVAPFDSAGIQKESTYYQVSNSDMATQSAITTISMGGTNTLSLAWDPSPDAQIPGLIAGYRLYYGTNYGIYSITNTYTVDATFGSTIVYPSAAVHYFALTAFNSSGLESVPCLFNLINQDVAATNAILLSKTGINDQPQLPQELQTLISQNATNSKTSSSSSTNVTLTQSPEQVVNQLGNIPPKLYVSKENQQMMLIIRGTIGATAKLEVNTALTTTGDWKIAAEIPLAQAEQIWIDPDQIGDSFKSYRISMPYDYAVLANMVLQPKGYTTRLVEVRTPSLTAHVVCYLPKNSAFLDYNKASSAFELQPSGQSLREIAIQVSSLLNQNWTSASEFTMSDRQKQIIATVVKTDSTDYANLTTTKVAPSKIKIDF